MQNLQRKTLSVSRSLKYAYYHHEAPNDTKSQSPTLLLLHGFPDTAHLWADIVPTLLELPYSLLIPDLLGYAGTSKPSDPSLYNFRSMSDDLVEILDAENITSVIAIGHDWGSALAQRLYLFHPQKVVGLILLNVAYMPPDQDHEFDLGATNAMMEKVMGYPALPYWELFTAEDAPKLIQDNAERFYEVLHGDVEDWMKKMFCTRGAMREYLMGSESVPLKPYARDPTMKKGFVERLRRDGMKGPVNWYHAPAGNIHSRVEKEILKENLRVKVPVLFIGCTGDAVCHPAMIDGPKQAGLLPDLKVSLLECAHWCPMEKPQEVAEGITVFLKEKY